MLCARSEGGQDRRHGDVPQDLCTSTGGGGESTVVNNIKILKERLEASTLEFWGGGVNMIEIL